MTEASSAGVKYNDIFKALTSIEKKVVEKSLSPNQLRKLFDGALNSIVPCDVTVHTSEAVSQNTMNVSAAFDQDIDEDDWEWDEYQFEFMLFFNPSDKKITISKDFWKWLKPELADAVIHEMLHRGQARSRNYAVNGNKYFKAKTKDQAYYGRPDEIEAFALNAASELKRNKIGIKGLTNPSALTDKQSATVVRYMQAFQSPAHPVMRQFLKKVYNFLKKGF